MNSIRCPQCGLINWATAEACKRCKLAFVQPESEADYADAAGATDEESASAHSTSDAPPPPPSSSGFTPDGADAQGQRGGRQPGGFTPGWPPPYTRSPYDRSFDGTTPDARKHLEIDFAVAPFIDTSTTVRDTYALSRSQFRVILRVVLVAIAPQIIFLLLAGTLGGPARPKLRPEFPSASLSTPAHLGAAIAPVSPTSPAFPDAGQLTGFFSLFIILLLGYVYLRWAVMPSALIYGVVTSLNTGEPPGVVECYKWGFRRSFSTGAALFLSVVLTLLGVVCLIVPGLIVGVATSLVVPVAAVEGCGALTAVRRSFELTKGRRGTIFAATFVWSALLALVYILFGLGVVLVSGALRSEVVGSLGWLVVSEVTGATVIVLTLVIYLGLAHYGRAGDEGWEAVAPSPDDFAPAPDGFAPGSADPAHAHGWIQAVPRAGAQQPAFAAPRGYAHAPQGGGSKFWVGLVVVGIVGAVVLIASVAAVVVPNMRGSRRAANEAATIKYLRMICSAEATYQSTDANGRYGTLEDLAGDNLIKGELATGSLGDYRFRVSVNGSHYEATATPISYGSTGGRSFYMAEDGVIRGGDHKGLPATSKDLPVRPGEIVTDDGDRPGKELPGGLPSSSGSSGASPSGW